MITTPTPAIPACAYVPLHRITIITIFSHRVAEEPDKFDKDFNDSESEEEDDGGKEENTLRKNERAAKVETTFTVHEADCGGGRCILCTCV